MSLLRNTEFNKRLYYKNNVLLSLLLLIPIFITSVFNFFVLYQKNTDAMKHDLLKESEKTLNTLSSNFNLMSKIVSQKRMDKWFSEEKQNKVNTAYYPIIHQLKKDSIWTSFFADVGYYSVKSGLVYRYNYACTIEEYFGLSSKYHKYYNVPYYNLNGKDLSILYENNNHLRIMRITNDESDQGGVLIAYPLELRHDKAPVSFMFFIISDKKFHSLLDMGKKATCLISYLDLPIYSSDPELIHTFESDNTWQKKTELSHALNMNMDGIAISWIPSSGYQVQTILPIVISEALVTFASMFIGLLLLLYISRKTYQPIQTLLEKLPSPEKAETVTDEFRYINLVLDDLAYSKQFYQESVLELRRDNYLYGILDNQAYPGNNFYNECIFQGIRIDRKYFACLLLEDSAQNFDLFSFLIAKEENNNEIENTNIYSLYVMGNKYLFILASDLDKHDFNQHLSQLNKEDSTLVRVSEIVEGVQNVRTAYMSVCWQENDHYCSMQLPTIELQFLEDAVTTANYNKIFFSLRMIKKELPKYNKILQKKIMSIIYELMRNGIETEFMEEFDADQMMLESKENKKTSYASLLDKWIAAVAKAKNNQELKNRPENEGTFLPRNLHTIMQYIEANYMKTNFSIKSMAADFGTTSSNLSHQFKKLTGKTLSGFIDELRMSAAEEFLLKNMPIQEIAEKLGYSTPTVFTQAFKRYKGMTPTVYRKKQKREKS